MGHTLIAGAGISGLSVALVLLQRGHSVTVLDRGTVGAESSWAGGGILSPLLPWHYTGAVSTLALRSMATYAKWVAVIEATSELDAELWQCGMLALDVADAEQAMDWCSSNNMVAHQQCPEPFSSMAERCVWLPNIAQVRNPRLVAALRAAVIKLGGVIHDHCPVVDVQTLAGRVTSVQTPTNRFSTDNMVVATGAWAGLSTPNLPAPPHIRPMRGQMLLFKLEPGILNTVLFRHGLYLIPRRDGHILVGSTIEDAGFDKSTDDATRTRLHNDAAKLLPALGSMQPIQHWAGLRPGSPDNIPIIDRHPQFENVFINAGHYRYGVTMAPASAALLVELMEGRTPGLDLSPYSWQTAQERKWSETP